MRFILFVFLTGLIFASCRKGEDIQPDFYSCDFNFGDTSLLNPNQAKYQVLLNGMTGDGVVGVTMSVFDNSHGMWLGCSGKADLHNQIDLTSCNITRVGSTVKMFTAAIVLKLQEEGKISLDDKISEYLNGDYINRIENADAATIRQLLQHSSGIYNYIHNLQFQTASLNDLIKSWSAEELLSYAFGQPAYFVPGEDVTYSNTNYILLGLLIENIEDKPLYQVFEDKIIYPLGLTHTQFAGKNPVPDGIIRGYIDLYSNFQVIESTYYSGWDYYTADGGLISNPYDLNLFFNALMHGQLLNANSLQEMLDWKTPSVQDPAFYDIQYGCGIFKMNTSKGEVYFHSGDAIGYYANMMYFPEDSTTVVYAVNSNYGKLDQFVSTKSAIDKVLAATKE